MVIVDIETSGLYPNQHSILSIGAVEWRRPHNTFYGECNVWEGAEITDKALQVNGFTRKQIEAQVKTPGELCHEFSTWSTKINNHTLAGFNVQFDQSFLKAQFDRSGISWPFWFRWVDAHSVAYWTLLMTKPGLIPIKYGNSGLNMNEALEIFFCDPEPDPHNALMGAQKTHELFEAIEEMGGKWLNE